MTIVKAPSPVLAGPLGEELRRRLSRATADAQQRLGMPVDPVGVADPVRLHALISGLSAILTDSPASDSGQLLADHEAALERLRRRFDVRHEALARVHAAVSELRAITSPAAMLAQAPGTLCGASKFQRVILSLVSDGRMVGEAAHFAGDAVGAERVLAELRADPIRLEHPLIETELLRRRRATLVIDARLHPRVDRRLAALMDWSAYAVAPLIVGAQVVGVVHADRAVGGVLDVLDRDLLWAFASALGQAYESAGLMRALRHEREQTRQFLDWLGARSGELTDAPIRLTTVRRSARPPGRTSRPPSTAGHRNGRTAFEGLLTPRELDVLQLLADGRSNKAIAEALVISDGTVKFHVNGILRKLRASNRSEAVSRYLRLIGARAL